MQTRSARTWTDVLVDLKTLYPNIVDGCVESIDEDVAADLTNAGFQPTGQGNDPAMIQRTAAAARETLSRAFSRRSELLDLNSKAIRRALEFKRTTASSEAELSAALASIADRQADAVAAANSDAKKFFDKPDTPESTAFGLQAGGTANASTILAAQERARAAALGTMHKASKDFEEALELAHGRENGPLNFPQRMARLKVMYLQDLKEAANAVFAYRWGLRMFGHTLAQPAADPASPTYIYALSAQFSECEQRRLMDEVGRVEFTRVFSITFATAPPGNNPVYTSDGTFMSLGQPPSYPVYWSEAPAYIRNRKLRFKLSSDFFPGLGDLRLLAVGMRCACNTPHGSITQAALLAKLQMQRLKSSPGMFGCQITPPRRADDISRPSIRLGQIPLIDGGSSFDPVYESGPSVESCQIDGASQVEIDPHIVFPSDTRTIESLIKPNGTGLPPGQYEEAIFNWNGYEFRGINLFLRVSAVVSTHE